MTMPTFKQQAEDKTFNNLLFSKISEIFKSNPISKPVIDK